MDGRREVMGVRRYFENVWWRLIWLASREEPWLAARLGLAWLVQGFHLTRRKAGRSSRLGLFPGAVYLFVIGPLGGPVKKASVNVRECPGLSRVLLNVGLYCFRGSLSFVLPIALLCFSSDSCFSSVVRALMSVRSPPIAGSRIIT
ncbi:hypothetical protein CRG98_018878 [Punica granatum]|uniref:Uncharacterized protein n=1 Tax=Punica granatum TaxID=22663 RepID=A0A2I0JWM3_PUNGR|nr:hypothetical protein CRG98_018878 [Punica granatum]